MTDKLDALAQRIVAQGVGRHIEGEYYLVDFRPYVTAEQFCNDGRVVLALLEGCRRKLSVEGWCKLVKRFMHLTHSTSLGPDFCEACCEALEHE